MNKPTQDEMRYKMKNYVVCSNGNNSIGKFKTKKAGCKQTSG